MCSEHGWLPYQLVKISLSFSLPVCDWMPPKNGIVGGPSEVSDRWREYFEKLLNEENEWNGELSAEYVEGPADMISKEEVRQAIQDLKVRKAAGPSSVTAEIIKAAGEQAVDWLTSIW